MAAGEAAEKAVAEGAGRYMKGRRTKGGRSVPIQGKGRLQLTAA